MVNCKKPVLAASVGLFLIFIPVFALAEEEKLKASTTLEFQLSTRPEAKIGVSQSFTFPFMQGTNPLTVDNNVTTVFTAEVTPVSLNGIGEVTLTPVAFFLLSGGGRVGSGWHTPIADGIGINTPLGEKTEGNPRKAEINGDAFDGLLWSAWGAGTLQFDLGAVIPGDWNHVLFQTRQELRYAAYTKAGSGDSWIFENDDGENKNGWIYYSNYVLGYRMPLSPVLDTIALMAEMRKSLYNTSGGDFWGESLGRWIFSGFLNLTITPRLNTALGLQMRTHHNYGTSNFGKSDYFYQDLELRKDEGKRRVIFYRAALIFSYKICRY